MEDSLFSEPERTHLDQAIRDNSRDGGIGVIALDTQLFDAKQLALGSALLKRYENGLVPGASPVFAAWLALSCIRSPLSDRVPVKGGCFGSR